MRSRISITLGIATLSLAAVACTAILGDFEEGAADSALSDATVDTGVADTAADTSSDTSVALDSDAADASSDALSDAPLEASDGDASDAGFIDSGRICLPTACDPNGPVYCAGFDALDGGQLDRPFKTSPKLDASLIYETNSDGCGYALAFQGADLIDNYEVFAELPTVQIRRIDFDLYYDSDSIPGSDRVFVEFVGPSAQNRTYSVRLGYDGAVTHVSIGDEDRFEQTSLQEQKWHHLTVQLSSTSVQLVIDNGTPLEFVPTPRDSGVLKSPWVRLFPGGPCKRLLFDNLVVDTRLDGGP